MAFYGRHTINFRVYTTVGNALCNNYNAPVTNFVYETHIHCTPRWCKTYNDDYRNGKAACLFTTLFYVFTRKIYFLLR